MATLKIRQHPDADLTFEELYNQNFARVNRYLRYRVVNTWDADDLTTLVFIKAYEKFHTYRGQSAFSSWIFRIAHNVYVDYVRAQRELVMSDQQLEHATTAAGEGPEEQILHNEELNRLRQLLNKLPDDYRDVVALRYFGELRFAQIGEVLGKNEAGVRMIHHRALKLMRRHIKNR